MDQEGLLEGLHTTEHTNILERHLKNEPRFLFGGNSPKGCNIGFLLTSNDRSHQDRVKESNVVKCQNFQNLSGQSTGTCDSSSKC